jgi:hypothetical protein
MAAIDRSLGDLADRVRRAVRRSYWFSGLAWAYGVAVIVALLFPGDTTVTTSNGAIISGPWWMQPIGLPIFLSLNVVVGFAVHELLVARREALQESVAQSTSPPSSPSEGGWIRAIQESQKAVTRMKYVAEFAFIPLTLGLFADVQFCVMYLLSGTSVAGLSPYWFIPGALPVFLLAVPLYIVARRSIAGFQTRLDRQVGELARLEAEFLWRFTGPST